MRGLGDLRKAYFKARYLGEWYAASLPVVFIVLPIVVVYCFMVPCIKIVSCMELELPARLLVPDVG